MGYVVKDELELLTFLPSTSTPYPCWALYLLFVSLRFSVVKQGHYSTCVSAE